MTLKEDWSEQKIKHIRNVSFPRRIDYHQFKLYVTSLSSRLYNYRWFFRLSYEDDDDWGTTNRTTSRNEKRMKKKRVQEKGEEEGRKSVNFLTFYEPSEFHNPQPVFVALCTGKVSVGSTRSSFLTPFSTIDSFLLFLSLPFSLTFYIQILFFIAFLKRQIIYLPYIISIISRIIIKITVKNYKKKLFV